MHLPPPAQWSKGRGRAHALAVVFLSLLNIFVIFALYGLVANVAWCGLLAFSAALSLKAAWGWWFGSVGLLRWTGKHWQWSQALGFRNPQACEIHWSLDFQTFVLVHMHLIGVAGRNGWIWLERGNESPVAWMAMRRALVVARQSPFEGSADGRG